MSNQAPWLLYGAYGYTGRLIAEEAVRRGMKPVLAGRNALKLSAVAEPLGCPSRAFSLDDPAAIGRNIEGQHAVLHCAGPFSTTAEPMLEACLAAGTHYLDITGEIAVIESAAARHERAAAARVTMIPAVGFDVVPSDCLAAMLAHRLPGANLLQLAFAGTGAVSPGTAKTMLERLPQGGRVRIDGRITEVPVAWKSMDVPFRTGRLRAVTIPWGDVATAWYSTGIPNTEVYLAISGRQTRLLRVAMPVLRLRPIHGLARAAIGWLVAGPSPEELAKGRGSFWGRVTDSQGNHVQATLETPNAYQLTVWTALAAVERVLAGSAPAGFATPSKAFGAEFILSLPGTDFRWEK